MVGVELVADQASRTRPPGDVLVLMPPLAMPAGDLAAIVQVGRTEVCEL